MQLLERTSQLQALTTALNQAKLGQGCIALVYGEAGIGKTSLVEHFLKEHEKTWRILSGACDSLFTPRPLGPLYDIALQTQGGLLSLLDSESSRGAIFSACLRELKEQGTILVIEDIHWADEATLDLLKYLGRRIRQTNALMILTYRDDELGVDHPLRTLLGDLTSSHAVHRIPVSSLSRDAVHELAKNKKIDPIELHRLTNGNPFFVTEVLAVESGIPETVREAVLARAARLSAAARSLLEAAAVIGSRAEPWLLSSISDAESTNVEECISRGMLQVQGDYYIFRHELAWQTILESISPQRRLALHRKTLDALKESPVTRENLARLAYHAEALNDPHAVLEYAPLAAWWASELGAHREAATHYRTALQFANVLPAEKRAELLDSYSDECEFIDQLAEAKSAQMKALDLWKELGQRDKEGRALRKLAELSLDLVQSSEMERYASEAIALLETLPPSNELAMAYSVKSRFHMNALQAKETIHWGSLAMELAEQLGDVGTLVHALNNIGMMEIMVGSPVEGIARLERSLQISLASGLHTHAARAFVNLADTFKEARNYKESMRYVSQGITYCVQNDLDSLHIMLLCIRATIYLEQGRWAAVEQDIRASMTLSRGSDTIAENRILLLQLQGRRGDPISINELESARQYAHKTIRVEAKCMVAALFAELAWLRGDLEQCQAQAQPMFEMALERNSPIDFGYLAYWMWRAGAIKEPLAGVIEPYAAQIRGDWQAAATMWEKYGCPYEQAMALMDGDEPAQLAALEIFERLGARPIMEKLRQKMRTEGMHVPRGPRPATRENAFGLTAREIEVLGCLVQGLSNNVIAKQLSLSTRTVEHHIASIFQKMAVQSRGEAVKLALKDHLLSSE